MDARSSVHIGYPNRILDFISSTKGVTTYNFDLLNGFNSSIRLWLPVRKTLTSFILNYLISNIQYIQSPFFVYIYNLILVKGKVNLLLIELQLNDHQIRYIFYNFIYEIINQTKENVNKTGRWYIFCKSCYVTKVALFCVS